MQQNNRIATRKPCQRVSVITCCQTILSFEKVWCIGTFRDCKFIQNRCTHFDRLTKPLRCIAKCRYFHANTVRDAAPIDSYRILGCARSRCCGSCRTWNPPNIAAGVRNGWNAVREVVSAAAKLPLSCDVLVGNGLSGAINLTASNGEGVGANIVGQTI